MLIAPTLRQIVSDKESLIDYSRGILPDYSTIEMRLFLSERKTDTRLPDHYYLRGRDCVLKGISSLSSLLSSGLHRLSDHHLHLQNNTVYVKVEAWPDWQELLTFCSPLPCISALLWKEKFRPGITDPVQLTEFMQQYIEPNTRYTCLPHPFFPALEWLLRDGGLPDLHVHLNGATETDTAWQIFLGNPEEIYKELRNVHQNPKAREQMEQEAPGIDGPFGIYKLLLTARRIRWGLIHSLFQGKYTPELTARLKYYNTESYIKSGSTIEQIAPFSSGHPMHRLFKVVDGPQSPWSEITLESMMYVLIIDRLHEARNEKLAATFHHYLLILGVINRFLVQQVHQYGFDQFQKITLNGFRETPEKSYARRFFQMHGNQLRNLEFLEGRFAPKDKSLKNIELIQRIVGGWEVFQKKCRQEDVPVPNLQLVCHFIKSEDREKLTEFPRLRIRHQSLRLKNWQKARSLISVRDNFPTFRRLLSGVDTAANELEAPPEVFAPIYRYLRRRGIRHFTYHTGEDFHHLVGGMRAIYEAVEFLGMQPGDRIGHGTAIGIEPALWLEHVGREFPISEGEWLDDMIFVLHLLEKHPTALLNSKLSIIQGEVAKHGQQIYKCHCPIYSYVQSWLLRKYCPFHMLYDLREARGMNSWSDDEWAVGTRENQDRDALKLLHRYHQDDCRKRYHKKIRIRVLSIFSKEDLKELQDILLSELHKREIVIEVLPTSNVRISFYKNHRDHHLWRWLGITKDTNEFSRLPTIVIGTDDTGIFSTNILNEYSHIYYQLINQFGQSHDKALGILKQLKENANIYAFKNAHKNTEQTGI
jgi:adenosine deaminase